MFALEGEPGISLQYLQARRGGVGAGAPIAPPSMGAMGAMGAPALPPPPPADC